MKKFMKTFGEWLYFYDTDRISARKCKNIDTKE